MSNKEILQKAFTKAWTNGYQPFSEYAEGGERREYFDGRFENMAIDGDWRMYIFNHDFAKAFWKDNKVAFYGSMRNPFKLMKNWSNDEGEMVDGWPYHLQQMVIHEKPLRYLEKFL
jgi:hypothetical protein